MKAEISLRRARITMAGLLGAATVAATVAVGVGPARAIVPGPNGRIAFESSRDGDAEIYSMNADGTVETQLTSNNKFLDVFPAWSPDGTKITFSSNMAQDLNALDVYVMNADGTGVTRLTAAPGEDRGTSWTSDGQTIVFHTARFRDALHAFDLMTMNADGTNQQLLFPNASAGYVCGDSATGVVVFNSNGNPLGTNPPNPDATRDFEIFTVNLDGTGVTQVTNNTVLDSGPKWSPDCSMIAYNSLDAGASLDVHRIGADGTDDVNLTNAPGVFDAFAAWSPDGTRVVFSTNRASLNFEIFSMDALDGSNLTRLTTNKKSDDDLRADWGTAPNNYGPPTQKEQCLKGGWTEFQTPTFTGEKPCVSYVSQNK